MKKLQNKGNPLFNKIILGISGIIIGGLCISQPATARHLDEIVAVVDDDVITRKDLQEYLTSTYMQMKMNGMDKAKIKKAMQQEEKTALQKLIDDKLIVKAANKKGVEVRREAIDKRLEKIKSKYPSEQVFLDALKEEGLTLSDLRKRITNQLKTKYMIDKEVRSKILIHPQEVTEYYNTHLEKFKYPERFDVASIFIPFANDKKAAKEKAETILTLIKKENGKSFDQIAKEYSKAPPLGIVAKGQLIPKIENILASMKEGDVSEVIETEKGYYIFKLKRVIPPASAPLEEVKDDIYNYLYQQQFNKRFHEWTAELRKNAFIEIKG